MNADTMSRILLASFIVSALIVSSYFLSACSHQYSFNKQDCKNFPMLMTDCMTKQLCGVRYDKDNVMYESCRLECEAVIHRQCLVPTNK